MLEPLDKILKAFKGFNMENMMNEAKWTYIREAIVEGYENMLNNLDTIPDHVLSMISIIYDSTQYYYPEDDDPSSTVRLK